MAATSFQIGSIRATPKSDSQAASDRPSAVSAAIPKRLRSVPPEQFSRSSTSEHFNIVEKLFAAIRGSFCRGRSKTIVQYDAEHCYPLVADLGPSADTEDDELFLRVTDFKVTDGAAKR